MTTFINIQVGVHISWQIWEWSYLAPVTDLPSDEDISHWVHWNYYNTSQLIKFPHSLRQCQSERNENRSQSQVSLSNYLICQIDLSQFLILVDYVLILNVFYCLDTITFLCRHCVSRSQTHYISKSDFLAKRTYKPFYIPSQTQSQFARNPKIVAV